MQPIAYIVEDEKEPWRLRDDLAQSDNVLMTQRLEEGDLAERGHRHTFVMGI